MIRSRLRAVLVRVGAVPAHICAALSLRRARAANGPIDVRRSYRAAVAALPDLQRDIFIHHRVDDLSIAEIALRLDLPAAEVEQHFADALLAIARAVEPHS